MKLLIVTCVVAAALARPDKLPHRFGTHRQQLQQLHAAFDQQFHQPTHFVQEDLHQTTHFDQQQFQQPSHFEQQQFQQPAPVQRQPAPQRPVSSPSQQHGSDAASSRPLSEERRRDRDAIITSFTSERNDGGARHAYTADNGLQREETIQLREVVSVDEDGREVVTTVPVVSGMFQFLLDDGSVVTRSYTTDERGHLVWKGTDLPQPQTPAPVYE